MIISGVLNTIDIYLYVYIFICMQIYIYIYAGFGFAHAHLARCLASARLHSHKLKLWSAGKYSSISKLIILVWTVCVCEYVMLAKFNNIAIEH